MPNRIKELRVKQGLTQEELAQKLNVKGAAVSKYENEKIPLTDDTIKKLSNYFNVTTDYLLGNDTIKDTNVDGTDTIDISELSDESQNELKKYIELLKIYDLQKRNTELSNDISILDNKG